ncbi:ligand-binding sensor domain-containing protein [Arsukibacterium perlucidum]|uniref:ligand-binding sensor domain-containing protein n=1 Tax=Arsukibacterium perlucidum TaxID=368811 RepID=UPI000374C1CD|nr:two-component regulator propeller domain-containing protein [Arsukibacterium perlucidum]
MKHLLLHAKFWLLLSIVMSLNGYAQHFGQISRLGIDDGLPSTTIYSLVQDNEDFIWLGAGTSGLLRYDGYQFEAFAVLNERELAAGYQADVGTILQDSQGNLWISTWGFGLSRLNSHDGKLQRFTTEQGLAGNQVQFLIEDQQQRLWVGTTQGISIITTDDQIKKQPLKDILSLTTEPRIWSVAQTLDGVIWMGSSEGLIRFDEANSSIKVLPLHDDAPPLSRLNEVRALWPEGNNIWVGSRQGVYFYESEVSEFQLVDTVAADGQQHIINRFFPLTDNRLLVASYAGVQQLNRVERRYQLFDEQDSLLSDSNIRNFLLDRSGVLWIATDESSLFRSRFAGSHFLQLSDLVQFNERELSFSVSVIHRLNQMLWLGSADKLYQADTNRKELNILSLPGGINAMSTSSKGELYLATDSGLMKLVGKELRQVDLPFELLGLANRNVWELLIDKQDVFYLGLWGQGVIRWDPESNEVQHWLADLGQLQSGDTVQALALDDYQQLWVGSRYSGLFKISLATGDIEHFSTRTNTSSTTLVLPSEQINCLTTYATTLVICTEQGLLLYQQDIQQTHLLGLQSGLPDLRILGVHIAEQKLFVSTIKGLSVGALHEPQFVTFNQRDGMVATELNTKAIDIYKNQLYLGSVQGLISIDLAELESNTRQPTAVLTRLDIDHQRRQLKPFAAPWQPVRVAPTERSIRFEFSALDYQDPAVNRFQYQLEGFDPEVSPQNYQLKQKDELGRNIHGVR